MWNDITEIRRRELAIRAAEEEARLALDAAEGTVEFGLRGGVDGDQHRMDVPVAERPEHGNVGERLAIDILGDDQERSAGADDAHQRRGEQRVPGRW